MNLPDGADGRVQVVDGAEAEVAQEGRQVAAVGVLRHQTPTLRRRQRR